VKEDEGGLWEDIEEVGADAWEGTKKLAGLAGGAISDGFNRLQDWYEKGGDEADIADELAVEISQSGGEDNQGAGSQTRSITISPNKANSSALKPNGPSPEHQPPPEAKKRPYASPEYPGVEEALGKGKLPKYMNPEGLEEQLVSEPRPPKSPLAVMSQAGRGGETYTAPPPKQLPQTPPFDKNRTTANPPKSVYDIMAQAGRGGETYTEPVPQSPLIAAYKQRHEEVNKPQPPPATRGIKRPAVKEDPAPQQGPLVDFYKQRHSQVNAPKPATPVIPKPPAEVAGPDTPTPFKGSVGTGTFPKTPAIEAAATAQQQAKIVDNATAPAKLPAGIRDTGNPAIESAVLEKMPDVMDRIQEEVGQYVINEDGTIDIEMIPYLEARRDYHIDNATRLEENAAIIGRYDVPAEVLGEEFAMARVYQQLIDHAAKQGQ
jgi:hypothetical protein